MLQVTQKVDVVCSAIGIKEAIVMLPFVTFICDSIKFGKDITFAMSHRQCVATGKILGELGFVNVRGENPLELIQELESDITDQCPE